MIRLGFFEKVRIWCSNQGKRIVKIAVYCNFDNKDLYDSYHQSLLQNYGVETIHTSNQGKNYADLQIAIDALNTMYLNNNIDEFMIMSNDKDMTPLLNTIRFNKRKVTVVTTGTEYNKAICSFSDEQVAFEDIIAEESADLEIFDIEQRFFDGFRDYVNKNHQKYLADSAAGSLSRYSHYGFEYNLDKQMRYYKLMSYEMANVFSVLYTEGKIAFYNYVHNRTSFVGVIPADLKSVYIAEGIIPETDFLDNYDINSFVKTKYQEAI